MSLQNRVSNQNRLAPTFPNVKIDSEGYYHGDKENFLKIRHKDVQKEREKLLSSSRYSLRNAERLKETDPSLSASWIKSAKEDKEKLAKLKL